MTRRLSRIITAAACVAIFSSSAVAATSVWYKGAAFSQMDAVHAAANGDMYFSDNYTSTLNRIPAGSAFANSVAQSGLVNGAGNTYTVSAVTTDANGNIYFVDTQTHTVSKITTTNGTSFSAPVVIAGTGVAGYSGDNGLAINATFSSPTGIAIDVNNAIYIADMGNNVIRQIFNGTIITIAGTGTAGYSGDNGLGTLAQLNAPYALVVEQGTSLYFTSVGNHVVRRIINSNITTVAGTGVAGFTGDGKLAMYAQLNTPMGITIDRQGLIYIADTGNNSVRQIDNVFIDTVARVGKPTGITVDSSDNVYVIDTLTKNITKIDAGVAGLNGTSSASTASCVSAGSQGTSVFLSIFLVILCVSMRNRFPNS